MATNDATLPQAFSREWKWGGKSDDGAASSWRRRLGQALNGVQISASTAALLSVNIAALMAACLLFFMVRSADIAAESALRARAERMEIANELGRTTNQSTRLARAYSVTGEERYRQLFEDIVAVRAGRRARPQPYDRTYWDLVIAGRRKNAEGRAVPILALGREAAYPGGQLRLFERADRAAEALIAIERDAMRQTPAIAQGRLFSDQHSAANAAVMEPLDTLLHLVEKQSDARVRTA